MNMLSHTTPTYLKLFRQCADTIPQPTQQPSGNNRRSDLLDDEVAALADRVAQDHRADVTQLACLIHLLRQMRKCQRTASACTSMAVLGLSLASMMQLQRDCTRVWMEHRGITRAELRSALASLERAEGTLGYLDSLPG